MSGRSKNRSPCRTQSGQAPWKGLSRREAGGGSQSERSPVAQKAPHDPPGRIGLHPSLTRMRLKSAFSLGGRLTDGIVSAVDAFPVAAAASPLLATDANSGLVSRVPSHCRCRQLPGGTLRQAAAAATSTAEVCCRACSAPFRSTRPLPAALACARSPLPRSEPQAAGGSRGN